MATVDETPNPIDVHVGARIGQRRALLGIGQSALAAGLDISFEQIETHENGTLRVSASRLLQIAEILQAPIGYFFDDGTAARCVALGDPARAGGRSA